MDSKQFTMAVVLLFITTTAVYSAPESFLRPLSSFERGNGMAMLGDIRDPMDNTMEWGDKGARLAAMKQAGLPVPDGFVIGISEFQLLRQSIKSADLLNTEIGHRILEKIRELERLTGRKFGDPDMPLTLAIRPGAPEPLPGLMATTIVGINDENVWHVRDDARLGLALEINEDAAYKAYASVLYDYATAYLGLDKRLFPPIPKMGELNEESYIAHLRRCVQRYKAIIRRNRRPPYPQNVWNQLKIALELAFKSWDNLQSYPPPLGICTLDLKDLQFQFRMLFGDLDATADPESFLRRTIGQQSGK